MVDPEGRELVARKGELVTPGGAARSTESVAFGSQLFTWADVPAVTRRAVRHRPRAVAEQACTDGRVYEVAGTTVQVLRAWRAHRDRLYVVVAERPVRIARDGVSAVDGWHEVSVARYDAATEMKRRVGWVPAGTAPGGTHGGPSRVPPTPHVGPAASSAAVAWPYLPGAVRDGAQRAVPLPEDWLGGLVQHVDTSGMPTRQEIVVLRRDAQRAIVVSATREHRPLPGATQAEQTRALAAIDWFVEQFDLDLRPVQRLEARREPAPWD